MLVCPSRFQIAMVLFDCDYLLTERKTKMKFTLLVFLFLAVSASTHATDASQARKSSGESANAKKEIHSFATVPFDPTSQKLPPNYRGHSIFDILKKLSPPRAKGEFEKSEEFDARVARWKETAFLGKITPTDLLAFEVSELLAPDTLSIKYDADSEKLAATISFKSLYFGSGRAKWLATFYESKNLGSHTGVTRMGVKFRVTRHLGSSVGLGIQRDTYPVKINKSMSRDEAVRVKPLISAYAIANLEEPYKINDSESTTASLDSPSEWLTTYLGLWVNLKAIWLVNRRSGEVIAKVEAPFFLECRYGC